MRVCLVGDTLNYEYYQVKKQIEARPNKGLASTSTLNLFVVARILYDTPHARSHVSKTLVIPVPGRCAKLRKSPKHQSGESS